QDAGIQADCAGRLFVLLYAPPVDGWQAQGRASRRQLKERVHGITYAIDTPYTTTHFLYTCFIGRHRCTTNTYTLLAFTSWQKPIFSCLIFCGSYTRGLQKLQL